MLLKRISSKGDNLMCIICVKPSGVAMPTFKTLSTCWQDNKDGAGLCYNRADSNEVYIVKGFMKLKALKEKLLELNFGLEDNVVIHFRFATHGLVDAGNCHPFPLSSSIDDLRCTNGVFNTAIAHNGVFGSMTAHETLSDTQKFIRGILANPAIIDNLDNKAVQELISGYCGTSSKLAILRPNKMLLIGHFIKDDSTGLYFSNNGYKPSVQYITGYGQGHNKWAGNDFYNKWDDVEDDKCLLCEKKETVRWRFREESYLCDSCYEFNLTNSSGCQC